MAKQKPEKAPDVPVAQAKAAKTQSLVFKRTHPGYAYWPGDTADLTAEHVKLLVDGGFAELAPTSE